MIKIVNFVPLPTSTPFLLANLPPFPQPPSLPSPLLITRWLGFGERRLKMSTYHVHKVGHVQSSQDSRSDVLVVFSELCVQQDRRCELT